MKFKKTTNNNILLIFFIFIILILLQNNKFFRKLYNVHGVNLDTRLINIYGYCGQHSYGFLKEVKNRYHLKKNLNIADYIIQPNSAWLVYNTSKETSNKTNIFLNYKKNLELNFSKQDKVFISDSLIQETSGIKEIKFIISPPINTTHIIEIFKVVDNNKIVILEKEINFLTLKDNNFNLNYNTKLINTSRESIYIALKNSDNRTLEKINSIKLILKNEHQILDKNIIFKKENCFYTR